MWRRRWVAIGLVVVVAAGMVGLRPWGTGAAARTIAVGQHPWSVSADTRTGRFYIVDRTSGPQGMSLGLGNLSIVDPRSGAVLRNVAVGTDPRAIAVDETRGRIYVANDDDSSVSVLDARSGAPLRVSAVGAQPRALTVDVHTGRVFVVNSGEGTVSMLDEQTGKRLRTLHLDGISYLTPASIVADGDRVLVASGSTLTVLDARSGKRVRIVDMQTDIRRMAVDDRTGRVFIVGQGGLGVIDPRHGWGLRMLASGGRLSAVAVDGQRNRVYVADVGAMDNNGALTGSGSVSVVDAGNGRVLRTIPVGVAPSSVAVDERSGRAVVINAGGEVAQSSLWAWLPPWLTHALPFLPSDPSARHEVAGTVSVIDPSQ